MLFDDFLKKWLARHHQDALNGDKSHEYVNMLHTFYQRYWRKWWGSYRIDSLPVGYGNAQRYYDALCNEDLSPSYRALIMSTLKAAVSDAVFEAGLPMPRWPKVNGKNYNKRIPQVLTEEQQDKVLEFVPEEHKAMVMMFFYHGLRMVEIRKLTWDCFDRDSGILQVKTAKGGNDRKILLESKLFDALSYLLCNYCITKDLIFTLLNGKPYTHSIQHKIIRKALNEAGFSHITPNQAGRHSAATNYLKRGASTRQVQYLLGHSKITTTERYTHPEVLDQEGLRRGEND
jgi:integrase/recombinase XerD